MDSWNTNLFQSGTVLELLKFLDELLAKTRDSIHGEFDVTLFCWTLLLTSSAFDVIICNKRKVDRWSFLAGEYTQSSQSEKFMDIGSRLSRKYGVASNPLISKYVYSNSKNGGEQDVHLSSIQQKTAAAKAHLESLWEDHVQVIEAMKASIKMKQLLEEKAQSVHEMLATKKKQAESEFTKKVVSTIQEKTVNDSEKEDISAFFDSNVNVSTGTDTAKDSSDMVMSKFPKSSSRGKSGSSKRCRPLRSRQLSVRLKLPMNICLSVARGLLTLLCKSSTKLPMIARLIACKLASRICAHASCSTIPLITVLKDNTESLLKLGICEQNSHWIRHAVLCLCLDVIESETRTVAKSSHMTINTNDEMKAGFVPDEGDLENLCAKLTKDAASLKHIESLAAKRFVGEADIEARQSTGITASKSGLGQPWLEAKTSELFSIANYDSNPTDESTMKTMVDQALDLIYPIELPKCNIDFSERKISLRSKCKEAITLRILNDEPFCMIFRWIDIVRNLEARLANSSNDNLSYSLALNAMKLEPIELEKDCQGFSPSAAIACLRNEYSIIIQDVQKKNGDKVVDGGIEKSSEACLVTASGGSSSPSVPGTPVTRDQEQSFDEMVMEEVSAILDRQDLQAVDALDAYANIVSVDITKDAEALFHSTSHEKLGTECEKSSSERGVESSVKEFDDTQIRRIPGKTWEVTVSSGSKAAQVNGKRFDKQALLNHLTTSFLVEMWSCSEDSLVQPCSFSVDERAECQLGLRQSIDCLYLESFADTLLRYSIRHLNPWRCLPTSLPVSDDDNAVLSEMGKTLNVILEALSRFVIDISPSSPVDYVQRLLSFLCDLQAGLSSCAQRIILDGQWVLPPNGILRLMSFPVKSDEMTEQAWTLILRTLTNSARNNVSCTQVIVASQWMEPLVERFLGQCISQFSESTLVLSSFLFFYLLKKSVSEGLMFV
ncbi:hypothetical protein AB6A40_006221 [Gnathostoma spinigerum]|uniref:Uncharacterized protein n=1 Tax=Gnathostoma spinigerum TaxID=75299 RepID=A0ABD6EJY2_9BILA